jgi:hypothetical protein
MQYSRLYDAPYTIEIAAQKLGGLFFKRLSHSRSPINSKTAWNYDLAPKQDSGDIAQASVSFLTNQKLSYVA